MVFSLLPHFFLFVADDRVHPGRRNIDGDFDGGRRDADSGCGDLNCGAGDGGYDTAG